MEPGLLRVPEIIDWDEIFDDALIELESEKEFAYQVYEESYPYWEVNI